MRASIIFALLFASACAAQEPAAKTLTIAPLVRGTFDLGGDLTGDIMKSCPASIHVNEYASSSDLRLKWSVTGVQVPFMGARTLSITGVLYRTSDGGVDHVFNAHSVSALAHDLCSYVSR